MGDGVRTTIGARDGSWSRLAREVLIALVVIPATSYVVRFLGDPDAASSASDLHQLARDYATDDEARAAWWKLINALPTGEIAQPLDRSEVVARLAFQPVFPGHGPVTQTEFRAFRQDGQILWSNGCIDWEPATMRIMPDFGGAYSWAEDGCQIDVDLAFPDVPGITEMHEAFADWQRAFDVAPWEPAMPMLPGFDWPPFHAKGLELAGQLKLLLGDRCQVIYEKPYEDPGHKVESMRLMAVGRPTASG